LNNVFYSLIQVINSSVLFHVSKPETINKCGRVGMGNEDHAIC